MTAVVDLDDKALQEIETIAHAEAMELLRGIHSMQPYPKVDALGIRRHGFGRPIEKRPITEYAASVALSEDVKLTVAALRGRVFELVAVHPEAKSRLKYLYAIADLLGAEKLNDWSALWDCLRRQDWDGAAVELMTAQWDRLFACDALSKRHVMRLVHEVSRPEWMVAP
ncbi:hypothetical protein V3391_06580 [Luteimonas sp. SMYT11W]|uniref:DNA alkylation repair protein n=1 Tax=Luteimonas flava TaxID=3115822 RepID=A0ABU7WEF6_9GAMM